MSRTIRSHQKASRSFASVAAAILATQFAVPQLTAATYQWTGASGGAWLTTGNWSPNTNFPGSAPGAVVTGEGAANDIATVAPANAATNIGINMNTLTAGAGGVGLILGGIDFNKTNTTALQIGNSSGTVNGILQINGETINGVANTLVRVTGSANLTIADVNTGTGTQTMGLRLGNTNGIFNTDTSRTLTISSIISEPAATPSGFTKTGAGTLTLTRANTMSGPITHSAGILSISNGAGLGTGSFTFNGYNKLILNVADGASMTVANNIALPASGTGGENELIRVGDGSPTAGTTARLTGVLSGGAVGQTYTLLDSDQGSNHNNTLILDNAGNTFTGTIETWRGTLAITSDGALGNVNNALRINNDGTNGGLRFDANNITTAATRTFNLVTNEKFDTNGNNAQVNGVISGAAFTKVGAGTLTLAGTNTYTGTTTINGGILAVSGGAAIANGSAVTLANTSGVGLQLDASETVASIAGGGTTGGNVNLNGNTLTLAGASATTFAGVISGTNGVITKSGNSLFTLTGSNTYTGGTNLNAGSLSISNGSGLGTGTINIGTGATSGTGGSVSTVRVANTAAVTLANNIVLPAPGAATTYSLVKNTSGTTTGTTLNLTGNISGGGANTTLRLNSDTASDTTTTYRLAGTNTNEGFIELYRGAIVVTNNSSLGNATLNLNGNNNTTLGDLRFENSVTLSNTIDLFNTSNPDPINTLGNNVTLAGTIKSTGNQALVKIGAGTLIFTGSNTYTPATTISAGTLQIGNGSNTGDLGNTSGITNNATLAVNRNNAFAISQVISGSGAFRQDGTGTTTLAGSNTYTGTTTVNAGTLLVSGSISGSTVTVNNTGTLGGLGGTITGAVTVNSGGTLAPGAGIGTLSTGPLTLNGGSTFALEINTTTGTTDLLASSGSLSLALTNDAVLSITDTAVAPSLSVYPFISYASGTWNGGLFTYGGNVIADQGLVVLGSQDFILDYNYNDNSVALIAVPEPNALLAALSGMAVLVGIGRKRRRSA